MKQICKYLVNNERDALWGLYISTVGYEEILPGDSYPTKGHADGYYFDVTKGRTLNEYQLLYLTEGEGTFQSAHQRETRIKEGDLFIDDRIKYGFLTAEKPIYHVGFSSDIVRLYESAYQTALDEAAYFQQMLAGIVNHLLGLMYSLERNRQLNKNRSHVDMINKARLRIRESLESDLTIQQVADELGVSYSNFRKLFKEFTGISPSLYQQDLKLQRAKELLSTTDMSIKEIAYQLNFESPDYFSSKFRAKVGRKPSEFRNGV